MDKERKKQRKKQTNKDANERKRAREGERETLKDRRRTHSDDVIKSPGVLDGAAEVQAVEGFAERAVTMTLERESET